MTVFRQLISCRPKLTRPLNYLGNISFLFLVQHTCFSLGVDPALKSILLYTTCMDGQEYVFNLFLKEYKMPRSYSPQTTKSRYKSLSFIIYDLLCFIGKDSGVVFLALSTIWNSVMYSTLVLKHENIKVWNLLLMRIVDLKSFFFFLNDSHFHFNVSFYFLLLSINSFSELLLLLAPLFFLASWNIKE